MKTTKEIAQLLDGIEYPPRIKDEAQLAKDASIVICYGASDDLVEFEGAFSDEASGPGEVYLQADGLLQRQCDDDRCPHEIAARKAAPRISAIWHDKDGPCWTFETSIPHETFRIMEDGEVSCVGIVFRVEDIHLGKAQAAEAKS
jgi:hypothetical protein